MFALLQARLDSHSLFFADLLDAFGLFDVHVQCDYFHILSDNLTTKIMLNLFVSYLLLLLLDKTYLVTTLCVQYLVNDVIIALNLRFKLFLQAFFPR